MGMLDQLLGNALGGLVGGGGQQQSPLMQIALQMLQQNGGISGVAVLAESNISVHTWPERGYAAFDVFMCGDAEPRKALKVFEQAFSPERVVLGIHKRGVL